MMCSHAEYDLSLHALAQHIARSWFDGERMDAIAARLAMPVERVREAIEREAKK